MSLFVNIELSVLDIMVLHAISKIAMKADVCKLSSVIQPDKVSYSDNQLGPRCNSGEGGGVGLSTCLCIHAEENALLEAGRERIREGSVLYCDT